MIVTHQSYSIFFFILSGAINITRSYMFSMKKKYKLNPVMYNLKFDNLTIVIVSFMIHWAT